MEDHNFPPRGEGDIDALVAEMLADIEADHA